MKYRHAIDPETSVAWMLPSTHMPGFSLSGPVSKRVIFASQMSRPSKLAPMLSSCISCGWRAASDFERGDEVGVAEVGVEAHGGADHDWTSALSARPGAPVPGRGPRAMMTSRSRASFMRYVLAYLAAAVVFLGLDALWLGAIAGDFYRAQLGGLLLERPVLAAAGAFYALYVVGIVVFAVAPGLRAGSAGRAAGNGALFGFIAYATYDLTNLATLAGWSTAVSLLDMAWGAVVTAAGAVAGFFAARRAAPRAAP